MLLVDIGNTRIKCVVYNNQTFTSWPALDTRADAPFKALPATVFAGVKPRRVVVANVAGTDAARKLAEFTQARFGLAPEFIRVRQHCAGMTTAYRDPGRLGVDRWLAALAAWRICGTTVCVVDAGTALTVDVVTAAGEHLGGLIAPGLELMRSSLTRGTAHLTSESIHAVDGFADNTEDAIALGCTTAVHGLLDQVRARIMLREDSARVEWFFTGGAAGVISDMIDWPCTHDPLLVQRGLLMVAQTDT